jgi:putative DNA primase/helicase
MSTNFEHMSDIELAEAEALLRQARERADQKKAESKKTYEPTELGNAKRFTGKFRGDMLFVPDRQQWFYWDERLWTVDFDGYAIRQFEKVIDDVKAEMVQSAAALTAVTADSDAAKAIRDEVKELGSWYRSSQRINIMRNSLALAAVQPDMSVPLKEFDKKGHFFGCANGIIDLRDHTLITGDKRYLMTKSSSTAYRTDAQCPEWDKFLFTIMNGKEENVAFLQRLVGQAMLGVQGKDKLAILWGSGANGKSTFVDTLNEVFGQYATVTDPRMLMDNSRGNREYYLAPLKGVRLVLMSETKRGDMIAESIVKMLVDGGEITARYPAGRVFTFQPVFTPILSTNYRPRVGADPAIWRRVLLVPFTHTIPEDQRNPRFRAEILRPEAEGILRWCVDGAVAYLRDGLAPTGDIVDATEEYKRSQDKIGQFISEECTLGTSERTTLKSLLDSYNLWCTDLGFQTMGRTTFKEELLTKSYDIRQSTGHQDWVYGIANRRPVSEFPHLVPPVSPIARLAK